MAENASDLRAVDSVALNDEDQVLDILRRSVFGLRTDGIDEVPRALPCRQDGWFKGVLIEHQKSSSERSSKNPFGQRSRNSPDGSTLSLRTATPSAPLST